MRRLALPGAWFAGFLFALHPACVEAVAWISEQKSILSGFFYLASAVVYFEFDKTRRKTTYLLAAVLFVLAVLSKTVTATLPAALLIVIWWRRGRLNRDDVLPLLPWLAFGAIAGVFTAWVEREFIGAKGPEFSLSVLQRCLLAGRVIWFCPLQLFGLLIEFSLSRILYEMNTVPVLGFLNVYPFVFSYVADHFQYLAMLGVIVPVAGLTVISTRPSPMLHLLRLREPVLCWQRSEC